MPQSLDVTSLKKTCCVSDMFSQVNEVDGQKFNLFKHDLNQGRNGQLMKQLR